MGEQRASERAAAGDAETAGGVAMKGLRQGGDLGGRVRIEKRVVLQPA